MVMFRFRSNSTTIWIAALYAIATLWLGVTTPGITAQGGELRSVNAAYALPGVDQPVICQSGDDPAEQGSHRHCDGCLPIKAGGLLPASPRPLFNVSAAAIEAEGAISDLCKLPPIHSPVSRGPPRSVFG